MTAIMVGAAIAGTLLAGFPLIVLSSAGNPIDQTCASSAAGTAAEASTIAASTIADLDATQLSHAATVIQVGRARGIPDQGIVIALATALQESRLRVYANDGLGGDLAGDQRGIETSVRLPHDAVGSDHGSLGIFQQQWPWWGTMRDLMDPATSAGLFYDALTRVHSWQHLPVTVAAQSVQNSAYPDAYADDEPLARRMLADLADGTVDVAAECPSLPADGAVSFPLPAGSGYIDQNNYGDAGPNWASRHTGTDLSVACGTPVLAATAGTLQIDTTQSWAGRWLVKVSTGPGQLATWYAHMSRVIVPDAATVSAGQQIGAVGNLGNTTGCHLHFEVHPHGGSIYEDPIDATTWLREHIDRNP